MDQKYSDAFHILGLREDASQEEIQSAFERLNERFSEVNYLGSPLWDMAAEKREKIRAAYELLTGKQETEIPAEVPVEEAEAKESTVAGVKTTATIVNQQGLSEGPSVSYRVREFLNQNDPYSAQTLLAAQPNLDTDPELIFLHGMTAWKRGWLDEATQLIEKAVKMSPDNQEYRTWADKIRNSSPSNAFRSRLKENARDAACGACGWCTCECLAEAICESICSC